MTVERKEKTNSEFMYDVIQQLYSEEKRGHLMDSPP